MRPLHDRAASTASVEPKIHRCDEHHGRIDRWSSATRGSQVADRSGSPPACGFPTSSRRQCCSGALPYRMDDLTATVRDGDVRLCEEGGFAVCRLDIRGTGSSEGIATDEYTPTGAQRHLRRDRMARRAGVVERGASACSRVHPYRLAQLPSGGFPAPPCSGSDRSHLRVRRPLHRRRALHGRRACKAVWTSWTRCCTWSACDALPPVPAVFGDGWRDRVGPPHRTDSRGCCDGSRSRGTAHTGGRTQSAPGQATASASPTMIVAGWADGYRNNALRGFEALPVRGACSSGRGRTCRRSVLAPAPHRLRAGDDPLLRPLVARRRQRHRPRSRPSPCSRGGRHDRQHDLAQIHGEWRAEATWPSGAADGAHTVTGRRRKRRDRGAGRPRPHGLDLLRRPSPVGATGRPARRRRVLAGLRVGSRLRPSST